MAFVFIKQIISKIVSAIDGFGFGKLSSDTQNLPPAVFRKTQFDMSELGLTAGTYEITVTALADGLEESRHSNAVKVKM